MLRLRKCFNSGQLGEIDQAKLRAMTAVQGGILDRHPALHVVLLSVGVFDQREALDPEKKAKYEKAKRRRLGFSRLPVLVVSIFVVPM